MGAFSALPGIFGISVLAAGTLLIVPPTAQAQPTQSLVASATIEDETQVAPRKSAKKPQAKPQRFESFAANMPSKTVAGFRMGGAPEVEFVFGDIDIFKRQIESFRDLHTRMSEERVLFSEATHAAQQVLAAGKARGACPADSLALDYAKASQAGLHFRSLGTSFESAYFAIQQLDQLGETSGLTPDYKWQVKKSGSQYRQALTDLREMRAVFVGQLETGLRARGCNVQSLLVRANEIQQETETRAQEEAEKKATPVIAANESPVVRASTATFFVDNKGCSDTLNVHVDGTLLGQVAPGTKAAFQSLMGRHSLCLLGENSKLSCGETGTLRNAFVYDGWSVSRHCDAK